MGNRGNFFATGPQNSQNTGIITVKKTASIVEKWAERVATTVFTSKKLVISVFRWKSKKNRLLSISFLQNKCRV